LVAKSKRKSVARDLRKNSILNTLSEHGPQTFNGLQRLTNYYPGTLSSLIYDLDSEGKIKRIIHQGKSAYTITKKGKGTIIEVGILGVEVTEAIQKGGICHDDYSYENLEMKYHWQLAWGIQDNIVIDPNLKNLNPISEKIARAVNELLYQLIKEDVKKKIVTLDPTKSGKIIFGLTIDYQKLVKSINEQSLYYLENMSKEELDFFNNIGDRGLTPTEQAQLDEMRKKTKAKIGVQLR